MVLALHQHVIWIFLWNRLSFASLEPAMSMATYGSDG